MRPAANHRLNPLHVMCRLHDLLFYVYRGYCWLWENRRITDEEFAFLRRYFVSKARSKAKGKRMENDEI